MRNAKRTCNRAYPIQQSHLHTLWQWHVLVHNNAASILRASFFISCFCLRQGCNTTAGKAPNTTGSDLQSILVAAKSG